MTIKAIVSDMDGSVVSYKNEPYNSSWDAISEALPEETQKKWVEMRDHYINNEDKYQEWFEKQTGLLKGLSVEKAANVLFPIPYSKGVVNFFNSIGGNYVKGLLSSGIDFVAKRVKEELDLGFQISNHLEIENGFFNGKANSRVNLYGKLCVLNDLLKKQGFSLEEICYIGDHINDISVFEEVGLPIAFNPKTKQVAEKARGNIIYDYMELRNFL